MNKPICAIQSPLFTRSGYGEWSLAVAKSILRYNKYDIVIAPTQWGSTPKKFSVTDLNQNDEHEMELYKRIVKAPLHKQPDLFIQISIPNEFTPIGKYNIGMTAGIETTIPPGEWIDGLNRMNLNIVTSQFSREVFVKSQFMKNFPDGKQEPLTLSKPTEVCFWGANTDVYKKTSESVETVDAVMSKFPEKFAYLFIGAWTNLNNPFGDRKDIGNLIKTFCTTFKDKKGPLPCLILKTSGANFSKTDKDLCLSRIQHVKAQVGGNMPNVYLLHGELSDVEMNALLNHEKVKVHISFTHGEGYGHPLLLATLSGKPLLAPKWSGHLDFLNPKYANLLEGNVDKINPAAVNQWLVQDSNWFTVSYSLAEDKIKQMYYNMPEYIKENAEKLRIENSTKFSIPEMDKVLHGIFDRYIPEFAIETPIVLPKFTKIELKKQ